MPELDHADAKYNVPNLERALSIVELLSEHPGGLRLSEITKSLGYPKNSVFRVTTTLWNREYLERDEQSRQFTLSRRLLSMGHLTLAPLPIAPTSIDVMRECRDATGETALIGTIVEDRCVVLEQVLGTHFFKFSLDLGSRINLHASAPGKAMLAYLPESELKGTMERITLTRYNERTITTRKGMMAELVRIRECGFAIDRGEELGGIVCIGAPVLDRNGYPIAALWITGPADRVTEAQFPETGEILRRCAAVISSRFGYPGPNGNGK